MPIVQAADVVPGTRVWLRVLARWVTVTGNTPLDRVKPGTDDVPMHWIKLGPDAHPVKAVEYPADQDVLTQGRED